MRGEETTMGRRVQKNYAIFAGGRREPTRRSLCTDRKGGAESFENEERKAELFWFLKTGTKSLLELSGKLTEIEITCPFAVVVPSTTQ